MSMNQNDFAASSIKKMAATFSNNDSLACKGLVVVLVQAVSHGSNSRLNNLSAMGDDVVTAVYNDEVAYRVMTQAEFDKTMEQLKIDLDGEQLLSVEITAFVMGEMIYNIVFENGQIESEENDRSVLAVIER